MLISRLLKDYLRGRDSGPTKWRLIVVLMVIWAVGFVQLKFNGIDISSRYRFSIEIAVYLIPGLMVLDFLQFAVTWLRQR